MKTTINDILSLPQGTIISYKLYERNRLGQKTVLKDLVNHTLERVVKPSDQLSKDEMLQYYGNDLSAQDYLQLSQVNTYRLVLGIVDEYDNQYYTVVTLDDYFLQMGLIEVEYSMDTSNEGLHLGMYGTRVKFDD